MLKNTETWIFLVNYDEILTIAWNVFFMMNIIELEQKYSALYELQVKYVKSIMKWLPTAKVGL